MYLLYKCARCVYVCAIFYYFFFHVLKGKFPVRVLCSDSPSILIIPNIFGFAFSSYIGPNCINLTINLLT